MDQSEHVSQIPSGSFIQEPLPFGYARTASTMAALAADLTNVAAPLVCTCVVMGVDASQFGPLRRDLALNLRLLLLDDEGAIAGPPVDDDASSFFNSADVEPVGLTYDPALDCECGGGGEAATDPRAQPSPTARWACAGGLL